MQQKILLCFALVLSIQFTNAQTKFKGAVAFNAGLTYSGHYKKMYNLGGSAEDIPTSQKGILQADFNFAYIFKTEKYLCKPLIGFGFTSHGFTENGLNTTLDTTYSFIFKLHYASLFGGYRIFLYKSKSVKLGMSQSLNPMFGLGNYSFLKKVAFSTRLNLFAEIQLKDGNVFIITPFFQSCITKFNKIKVENTGPNYFPYSFGINLGTYFKH